MSPKGNPWLKVREDEEFLARLKAALPATTGRAGGVSLTVRHLLRLLLDESFPRQHGERGRIYDLDEMEASVKEWESGAEPYDQAAAARDLAEVLTLLDQAEADPSDPLELLRLRLLVGRLHQLERKAAENFWAEEVTPQSLSEVLDSIPKGLFDGVRWDEGAPSIETDSVTG